MRCFIKDLKEGNITLQGVALNLVDEIWTNRPVLKPTKVEVQLYKFTGITSGLVETFI